MPEKIIEDEDVKKILDAIKTMFKGDIIVIRKTGPKELSVDCLDDEKRSFRTSLYPFLEKM